MKTTTKIPNELTIENSVVVLIDHQPWIAFASQSDSAFIVAWKIDATGFLIDPN